MEMATQLEHEQINVELRRTVVGYCDVTDFTSWIQESANAKRDVTNFIRIMKWKFRKFREDTGYFLISAGDGIIAVIDSAPEEKPVNVFNFIVALSKLSNDLSALAKIQNTPRPGMSRIRIAAGPAYKIEEPPLPALIPIPIIDYIGEPMNIGSRLLQIRRDIPALITKLAIESMTLDEQNKLFLELVEVDRRLPRGVKGEDIRGLCSFQPKTNE